MAFLLPVRCRMCSNKWVRPITVTEAETLQSEAKDCDVQQSVVQLAVTCPECGSAQAKQVTVKGLMGVVRRLPL